MSSLIELTLFDRRRRPLLLMMLSLLISEFSICHVVVVVDFDVDNVEKKSDSSVDQRSASC